ncbi:IS1634 family transposase [Methylomarinum sp. Ch1-1]|uniref:IS1634 family transposase n=1 Tax=Methylomarinum roseum TaxID=3067653 RepID=A0AAU7NYR0_9GAMM|nr:IS1634 family transposase [Methylomarinum sp. Ch1-1]MDP4521805.1 IS1634 family transposase [Methylomarinum sp. Ch1-1]
MATPQQEAYHSRVIHHLGLVSGMIDELGLVERIDALMPKKEQQIVSYGQAVKAIILNGLGFTQRALYLTPHFFRDKPVEHLIGEGITAAQLNDDLLGRTLDAIHAYGCSSLYGQLAVHSVQKLGLLCQTGHLDSTGFHVDGVYNGELPADEDSQLIHITQGYSRDHRPDLNQVVLQLPVERQAGIPLLMEPLSGNNADKTSFKQMLERHMAQLQQDVGLRAWKTD